MNGLVAYFVPERIRSAGGIELRRAQLAVKAALFLQACLIPALLFVWSATGEPPTMVFMVLGVALSPFALRWTGNMDIAGNLILIPMHLQITWFAWTHLGLHSNSLTALIYIPLMALIFRNRRSAVAWLVIILVTYAGLFTAQAMGYSSGKSYDADVLLRSRLFELASGGIIIFALFSMKDSLQTWLLMTLRSREAETRAVLETAPDGIMTIDASGRIIGCNVAAGNIFATPREALRGRHARELVPGLDLRAFEHAAVDSHVSERTEEHVGLRGEATFPMEVSCGLMPETDSARYVLVLRDISERKEAEDELVRARDEAQAASRAKSSFLANMSHELRTPLNAVIGYSEMIMEEIDSVIEDDEPGAELVSQFTPDLNRIRGAGKHLLSIINDILDLSKIEAGKMTVHSELFDSGELLDDIVSTVRPLADKNENKLVLTRSANTPQFLRSDTTKLRQILFNLLSNACKFTAGGTVELAVGYEERHEQVVFHVRDTGIGMTQEQMARIFDAFAQADSSTTREFGGTGLGLTITSHFCALLGGSINVESTPNVGTTFTVRLAADLDGMAASSALAGDDSASAQDGATPSQALRRASRDTILVVDDDPIMRDLLRRVIERGGFRVVTAASGIEGLLLARTLKPRAITLDVMMPTMDGWTMLGQLKDDPELATIPVVMVTMVEEQDRGFALGAEHYLTKPLDRSRLMTILDAYRAPDEDNVVLVVEDDEDTRQLMRRVLTQDGWIVETATNGIEALQTLEHVAPRLVLLDLMMPRMDGFEFLHRFRAMESFSHVPVVVVTAKELTDEDRERLDTSADRVVPKGGTDRERLLDQVRSLVEDLASGGRPSTGAR